MVQNQPQLRLPIGAELPCSDDTPVDNEDQNFIPNFLLFLLQFIWGDRLDWFFGIDMAVYHTTGASPKVPIVPDGFLSLGVERRKGGASRTSYVVWEENDIVPMLALEIVSLTYGGEYDTKMESYARLGVLYYLVYNPNYWQCDRHRPLEIYRLVNGQYVLQIGEPFFMPEIGLGIGRTPMRFGSVEQEVLSWYDKRGDRYRAAEEAFQQAQEELELAQQQAAQLASLLEQYRQRFGDLPQE